MDDRGWVHVDGSVTGFWVHPDDYRASLLRQHRALTRKVREYMAAPRG